MRLFIIALSTCALGACAGGASELPDVTAAVETAAVASSGDAADDPAIWINSDNPAESLIIGTDKQAGLYSYALTGEVRQFLPAGAVNNVDLRQDVTIGDWRGDIIGASNRTDDTISLFVMDASEIVQTGSIKSALAEPYGFCLGIVSDEIYAFVAHKTGDLIAYRLEGPEGGAPTARLKLETQLEGCVHDDEAGILFVGEEARGVWKTTLRSGDFSAPVLVDEVGGASGIVADVEGLSIYKHANSEGYLVASSQGDNSFAVYDRTPPHAFRGRFAVVNGDEIDGAEETDGIETMSAPLGRRFPNGLLVVQDGLNKPRGNLQNFKLIDWREVEAALGLRD
ncbi:MAG: phytase [Pseudomonadota bacterium]